MTTIKRLCCLFLITWWYVPNLCLHPSQRLAQTGGPNASFVRALFISVGWSILWISVGNSWCARWSTQWSWKRSGRRILSIWIFGLLQTKRQLLCLFLFQCLDLQFLQHAPLECLKMIAIPWLLRFARSTLLQLFGIRSQGTRPRCWLFLSFPSPLPLLIRRTTWCMSNFFFLAGIFLLFLDLNLNCEHLCEGSGHQDLDRCSGAIVAPCLHLHPAPRELQPRLEGDLVVHHG